MNIFVSSLISNFGELRDAAGQALNDLDHEVIRAEDFGATSESPQFACLDAVRRADMTVLLMGAGYGEPQQSGLSATHEEYREAKDSGRVIVFIQEGVDFEPRQQEFVNEVREWEEGQFTGRFTNPESLRAEVTRAMHRLELAEAAGRFNESNVLERATNHSVETGFNGRDRLIVVVASGPDRQVLRPSEMDNSELAETIEQEAIYGDIKILSRSSGVETRVIDGSLHLTQPDREITLDSDGTVRIAIGIPLSPTTTHSALSELIEEEVKETIQRCLGFAGRVLDTIDPTSRLTHSVVVVELHGAQYLPWRTTEEQRASPNSVTIGFNVAGPVQVFLTPASVRRESLRLRSSELAEDLAVLLRAKRQTPTR